MDVNDFKIKKWQWAVFIIVSAGLLLITESIIMSLGIMILLILADYLVKAWDARRRGEDDNKLI